MKHNSVNYSILDIFLSVVANRFQRDFQMEGGPSNCKALDCGAGIGRDSNDNNAMTDGTDDGTGVKADNVLFTIVFNSDKFPGNRPATNNNQQNNAENELGFSLDYRVSTSCADVTLSNMATG